VQEQVAGGEVVGLHLGLRREVRSANGDGGRPPVPRELGAVGGVLGGAVAVPVQRREVQTARGAGALEVVEAQKAASHGGGIGAMVRHSPRMTASKGKSERRRPKIARVRFAGSLEPGGVDAKKPHFSRRRPHPQRRHLRSAGRSQRSTPR
jgi:hypothetical protein